MERTYKDANRCYWTMKLTVINKIGEDHQWLCQIKSEDGTALSIVVDGQYDQPPNKETIFRELTDRLLDFGLSSKTKPMDSII